MVSLHILLYLHVDIDMLVSPDLYMNYMGIHISKCLR